MAYDKKKLLGEAKKAIEEHELFFVDDLVAFLPCSKSTLYKHFPVDSDELNELKELATINKIRIKAKLRRKWYSADAPALQLALYKLAASPEELKQLQMQHVDVTSGDKPFTGFNFLPDATTDEETA
jgi:hypothetical protein